MSVGIGVIGAGMIGADHIRRISQVLSGAQVVAVTDVDRERAQREAAGLAAARVYDTGEDVIAAADVDAVVVTSWGGTHEQYVLAAVDAGKPVFCEKPLATTQEACRRILSAEMGTGRRLVQVGFMRRYDPGYRAMKAALEQNLIGAPMLVHSVHRNQSVADAYTSEMVIVDTGVHDIDITRWLLGEEFVSVDVLRPRRNSRAAGNLIDPILMVLEAANGVLVDVEINVNAGLGYDIRGEIVGESGVVSLAETGGVVLRSANAYRGRIPQDWRERFAGAYDAELQEFVDAVRTGAELTGPSAWDGYAVASVSDAAIAALNSGRRTAVQLADRPSFYEKG